jgi:hypothetical protein
MPDRRLNIFLELGSRLAIISHRVIWLPHRFFAEQS